MKGDLFGQYIFKQKQCFALVFQSNTAIVMAGMHLPTGSYFAIFAWGAFWDNLANLSEAPTAFQVLSRGFFFYCQIDLYN